MFTQEELDLKIAEITKGMFTEEELTRRVTAETDRRVESGIQKGLETHKAKWKEEFEKQASMSAQELAEKKLKEQMDLISGKERELLLKENKLSAIDMLTSNGVPKAQYEKMLDVLVNDNSELTTQNINNFVETYKTTKTEIELELKKQLTKVPPPNGNDNGGVVTKEDFNKMSYVEKMKFKEDNQDLYSKFMK